MWPISHDPVSKLESDSECFTVDKDIKGSNLAKVVFYMIVSCETDVNKIIFDALNLWQRFDWLRMGGSRSCGSFNLTRWAEGEQPANFVTGDGV
jgi:hypothetical protein